MKLRLQATFIIISQIILICLIIFFSQEFGMGYENEFFGLDEEVIFLPGYDIQINLVIYFLFIFNLCFFGFYLPLRAMYSFKLAD